MTNLDAEKLKTQFSDLIQELGGRFPFKWDSRFDTALVEFQREEGDEIKKIILSHMGHVWETDNASIAPEAVTVLLDCIGGIQPGQLLFTSDPGQDGLLVFCAWWPWGNGTTISIRLGFFTQTLSDADYESLTREFKTWFDL